MLSGIIAIFALICIGLIILYFLCKTLVLLTYVGSIGGFFILFYPPFIYYVMLFLLEVAVFGFVIFSIFDLGWKISS